MNVGPASNIFDGIRHTLRMYTFPHWVLFGIFGVLPDIDHLVDEGFSRSLHIPMLVVAWLLCCAYIAHSHRLSHISRIGL